MLEWYCTEIVRYFREKLQREIAAREQAERKQHEYEDRLKTMQEEMELRQKGENYFHDLYMAGVSNKLMYIWNWISVLELNNAQETIRRLEEQLKELQRAKENLERKQNELEEMMRKLAEDKEMEAQEKAKLVSSAIDRGIFWESN